MNALLGGPSNEDAVLFRPPAISQPNNRSNRKGDDEPDISKMTAEEAAALLHASTLGLSGGSFPSSARYRTGRVLAHHQLAAELSNNLHPEETKGQPRPSESGEKQENADVGFEITTGKGKSRYEPSSSRKKVPAPAPSKKKRRRNYDSSSSSDSDNEDDGRRQGKRNAVADNDSSSSSDDDDGEVNHRRQRRLCFDDE